MTTPTTLTFEQFADKTAAELSKIASENRDRSRMSYDSYMDGCCWAEGVSIVILLAQDGVFDKTDEQIGYRIVRRAHAHELAHRAARPLTAVGEERLLSTLIAAVRHARVAWFAEQQALDLA